MMSRRLLANLVVRVDTSSFARPISCCCLCHHPHAVRRTLINKSSLNRSWTLNGNSRVPILMAQRYNHMSRTTKPWDSNKFPVIKVKSGIHPRELAGVMKRPYDDVLDTMEVLKIIELTDDNVGDVCRELGFRVSMDRNPNKKSASRTIWNYGLLEIPLVKGETLIPRPPVVTIMGHVDHGKTTILDSLRKSEIVKQEFGGITQHIGAFVVSLSAPGKEVRFDNLSRLKNLVTFLDTPGHAAFHAMRQRGADVTDIVVLVVAADDGVMDQTVESIQFAKNSNVPIVIAINKMDKINAQDERIFDHLKRGLASQDIVLEEDGGEYQSVRVSGLTGFGLDALKEAILAQAELLELKAYSDGSVQGVVIESLLDPRRGRLATILIKSGTLKVGSTIVAGKTNWAKVRSMFDEWGKVVASVGPGFPVQVIGWKNESLPDAGDIVTSTSTDAIADDWVKEHKRLDTEEKSLLMSVEAEERGKEHVEAYKEFLQKKRSSEAKFARYWTMGRKEKRKREAKADLQSGKRINVVIKADVNGSLEVLLDVIGSYPNEKEYIKVNIVHFGVGPVTESDLELASCFDDTFIYGFNVKNDPKVIAAASKLGVPLKPFNVIYHLVDDLKKEISAKLPDLDVEVLVGEASVQQEFLINEKSKKVPIAGARCVKGTLKKPNEYFYKLIRGDATIADRMKITSMRHLKEEVAEIKNGTECGLRFEVTKETLTPTGEEGKDAEVTSVTEDVRFAPGDRIICYQLKQVKQKTKWNPDGF